MTGDRVWHYVAPNETTRVPRRLIFVDCESASDRNASGHEQRWALAVARMVTTRRDRRRQDEWATFDDPEILWKQVAAWCGASSRTVLYTHNLGYDVRIAEALTELPRQGWALIAHNLATKGAWLIWRRGRATLHMCDSAAIFPTVLAKVGAAIGLGKLPLPGPGAAGVGLYSRCWRDVEIMSEAVLRYLDWIETDDLGNWQATGAGQSWATFRHRFMKAHLLVHGDSEALAAERRAMWTGRCEAYWHGELKRQVVHEWDLELAYGTICRDENVPIRLLGAMPAGFDWRAVLSSATTAVLAEVRVDTASPVVPAAHAGRIVWPAGRFTTTLWDVEIAAALKAGARVEVIRGWLYRKAPALHDWAVWCIGQVKAAEDGTDPWKRIVCKHWLRALVGRMAMTYTDWEPFAVAPVPDVSSMPLYDAATGETHTMMQVGQDVWIDRGQVEWQQSIPMVTGYVQAIARVRYWTILTEAPPDAALYGDTDSILVTDRHLFAMQAVADAHPEWQLRLKRSWQGFAVWGPRQIRTGPQVRIAGVPHRARQTAAREFEGEVWESLPGALAKGHPDRVVIKDRTWHIAGTDHRRDGPALGWTKPIVIEEEQHDRPGRAPIAGQ